MIARSINILLLICILSAEEKSFIREYTYYASEYDSKVTSRANALEQVKCLLLEEVSVFIRSEITMETTEVMEGGISRYQDFYQSKVQTITAGITETKILEDRWTGEEYWIKAEINLDLDDIYNKIDKIMGSDKLQKELNDIQKKAAEALAEVDRLRIELTNSISETEQLRLLKSYNEELERLAAPSFFYRGNYYFELAQYDSAAFFYNLAVELEPGMSYSFNNLGVIEYFNGNYLEASALFLRAITIDENNIDALANYGNTQRYLGNFDLAEEYLRLSILKGYSEYEPIYNIGILFYDTGKPDSALTYFERLIRTDYDLDIDTKGNIFDYIGDIYFDREDFAEAIKYYELGIEISLDNTEGYYNLGIAYRKQGNYSEAIRSYERALELRPNDGQLLFNLGVAHTHNGNIANAIKSYERAIELRPDEVGFVYSLGVTYYFHGDTTKAIQLIQDAARSGLIDAQVFLKENGYNAK